MLIRVFRGVIREGAHESVLRELRDDLLPRMRGHPQVTYVALGLPSEASPDEYLVESHWTSVGALAAVAGDGWRTPAVEEHERDLLVSVSAHHYLADAHERPGAGVRVGSRVDLDGLRVDGPRQEVAWDGSAIHVPPREMAALLALAADPGAPVTSAELARRIWPGSVLVTAYDVRRVIYELRTVLRAGGVPLAVRSLHGSGYWLEPPPGA